MEKKKIWVPKVILVKFLIKVLGISRSNGYNTFRRLEVNSRTRVIYSGKFPKSKFEVKEYDFNDFINKFETKYNTPEE